jgi:outer membrane protein TolC
VVLRGAPPLSLNEAQGIALKQNPEVLQAELEVRKTTANLKAVITQRYPKLLALAFVGQQLNSNYPQDLAVLPAVFQPLTQQYRLGMEVEEAGLSVRIAQQRLRLAKQRTVADVKNLYLSMLALQSSIASLETNFDFLNELARYVQAEVKRGAALNVDALVVQARVARADFEVDKAKDDINTTGQTLNRLLGRPARAEFVLVDEPVAPVPETKEDDQLAEAFTHRPELSELKFNIHRTNLEGKVQLSRYIPDISFGAAGIFSRDFYPTLPRNYAAVGFLATWEPWDWGRRIQLSKESNSKMRQEKVKLRDMTDIVSIDVDKARRDLKLADKEAIAGALAEESTKEQLRVVHRRFMVGAALLKDVLEAQSAYTKAIAENVKAKTDMAAARVELDEALGRDF